MALQNDAPSELYITLDNCIPQKTIDKLNKGKKWKYGYDMKYDVVVISKDGTIGEIVEMNGVKIALPSKPSKIHKRSNKKAEQYWEPHQYPKALQSISTIFQWNEMPKSFKETWTSYIDDEEYQALLSEVEESADEWESINASEEMQRGYKDDQDQDDLGFAKKPAH